jgi:guanine deaminase
LTKFILAISPPTLPRIGFDDSAIYAEITQPHAEREIPMIQMMREEALAAFRAWEEHPGKILY